MTVTGNNGLSVCGRTIAGSSRVIRMHGKYQREEGSEGLKSPGRLRAFRISHFPGQGLEGVMADRIDCLLENRMRERNAENPQDGQEMTRNNNNIKKFRSRSQSIHCIYPRNYPLACIGILIPYM